MTIQCILTTAAAWGAALVILQVFLAGAAAAEKRSRSLA